MKCQHCSTFGAVAILLLLSLSLLAPCSGNAVENPLGFEISFDSDCSHSGVVFTDCASVLDLTITIGNYQDHAVTAGSTVISDSLAVELRNSLGETVAWWGADEDPAPGTERLWQPNEREWLTLSWGHSPGPFSGEEESARSTSGPRVPYDGYAVVLVWTDLNGDEEVVLESYTEWLPRSYDDWRSMDRPLFIPPATTTSGHATLVGAVSCSSGPARAENRWVERTADDRVRVLVEYHCGPWASPSSGPLAIRLPSLPPGRYVVEQLQVVDGHESTQGSTTLVVTSDPRDPLPAPAMQ